MQPCCCLKAAAPAAPSAAQGDEIPKLPEQTASQRGRGTEHGNEVKMRLAWEGKRDGSSPDVTERGQAHTTALNPFHWLKQQVFFLKVLHFLFLTCPMNNALTILKADILIKGY